MDDAHRSRGSLWAATVPPGEVVRGRPVDGPLDADVAVVGAGYTALWTAYSLARVDPSLRIVVLEREQVGFGASGRNGGWCSALLTTGLPRLAAHHGRSAAIAMQRAGRPVDQGPRRADRPVSTGGAHVRDIGA